MLARPFGPHELHAGAQLEPSEGNIQWSLIDDEIAAAKARGGRFGMRVMALCQGCADHMYMNAETSIPDDLANVVNPLIGAAPGDTTNYLIPDWNSDAYFSRLTELLTAIATRYKDDPHFAWLKNISTLVVEIDEALARNSKADQTVADALLSQAREIIKPVQHGSDFQMRYYDAMQESPDVVILQVRIERLLGA